MRKRIVYQEAEGVSDKGKNWLDLEGLAQAEVTSEDAAHPIESALVTNTGSSWRAAQPGKQTVRILFDKPQKIRSIRLVFQEVEVGIGKYGNFHTPGSVIQGHKGHGIATLCFHDAKRNYEASDGLFVFVWT